MAAADAGNIRMGAGNVPAWGGAGEGSLFFDTVDGQLYYRRADDGTVVGPLGGGGGGPNLGTKYWLESTDNITVPNRFQYLVQGALIIDPGGSITADPGGQIVVIP